MNSIVIHPATYDSTALVEVDAGTDQLRQAIGLVEGLDDSSSVRGGDTIIPSADGQVPRNRVWDSRRIVLEGWVGGVGLTEAEQASDLRSLLESYRTLFDPTRSPATLSIGLEDGGTATISARPIDMQCPVDLPTRRAHVSIVLLAVEADWDIALAGS